MKALYRRYRPKTLSEVVGQKQITDILAKSISTNKLAHAYLFIGPRGTGKTSVARILAHEINGFNYELEDDYLDIIEIDAASNTGVDNIRDLREKAIIAPAKGKYKIYIIDEVHMLSKSAFNALLKTLEEPPEHVIFIMATTDAHKVPITITSRSQTFTFKLADPSTMFEHLKNIAKTENIHIDDDALQLVVHRGGGSFRDSLSLLDQISTLSDDKITLELITQALGLPQQEAVLDILNAYAANDLSRIRTQLQNLHDSGIKAETIVDELISKILENPQPIHLKLLEKLTDIAYASYPDARLLLALSTFSDTPTFPIATPPKPNATLAAKPKPTPSTPATIPAPTITQSQPTKAEPASTPQSQPQTTRAQAEPTPQPEPQPQSVSSANVASSSDDIWPQIIAHAQQKAPGIYRWLQDSDYTIENNKLTIYAKKKFAKTQISKHIGTISEILPKNYSVEVNDQTLNQDADMAAIAEIMGGGEEVHIDA